MSSSSRTSSRLFGATVVNGRFESGQERARWRRLVLEISHANATKGGRSMLGGQADAGTRYTAGTLYPRHKARPSPK